MTRAERQKEKYYRNHDKILEYQRKYHKKYDALHKEDRKAYFDMYLHPEKIPLPRRECLRELLFKFEAEM